MGTSSLSKSPKSFRNTGILAAATAMAGVLLASCTGLNLLGKNGLESPSETGVEKLQAQVLERLPADPHNFTQGLEVGENGELFIGTGLFGHSSLIKMDRPGGSVIERIPLSNRVFGEGITQYDGTIWQLSWQAGKAFHYDAQTLKLIGNASYPGEGWGLCAMDDELIMSDGTSEIRHLDPLTFAEVSRTKVTQDGKPINNLNELECVDGQVYANIWYSTDIVRIDPDTGKVTAVIDASPRTGVEKTGEPDSDAVLNGIAHIPGTDEFYLTGKLWPDIYRVKFEPVG